MIEVRIGAKWFKMTVDTGAARSLVRADLAKNLREDPVTRNFCMERLAAPDPKTCNSASENAPVMELDDQQLLTFMLSGFTYDVSASGRYRIRPERAEAIVREAPFAEAENLADNLIFGLGHDLESGLAVVHHEGKVYAIFRDLGIAVPARYNLDRAPWREDCRLLTEKVRVIPPYSDVL